MSSKMRVVNVVPQVKIKKEIKQEVIDDEDIVECILCSKTFASEMALNNHTRMEHYDVFVTGNPENWTRHIMHQDYEQMSQEKIRIKTEQLISSMTPTNLMSLASEDVSYIIIKSETPVGPTRKRKAEKTPKEDKPEKTKKEARNEPVPITGPFECLQPSTLVADGTCHQIFFSCCEYSLHFRDEHTRRRKGNRCQVCEKPLSGEDQAPYPCDVCGMGFLTNKQLQEHLASDHVKLKPFQCSVCNKRFTQQGGVQQHMRMHTGDRPFPCTFCPKAFTQKSGLDQHLRIHTKVKPYRCVICSKTFCQSVHLKQHMRTHTNVSPFQCGICSKRFKQSSHLNYHLKNHNPSNLNEDQLKEYDKMMNMLHGGQKVVYVIKNSDGTSQFIEQDNAGQFMEQQNDEGQEIQVEEDGEQYQEEAQVDEEVVLEDIEEQLIAEQSIQGDENDTYIVGDVNNEVWSVKIVDS